VAYHEGRKTDAKNLLRLAEEEARMMHVEPDKLTNSMLQYTLIVRVRLSLARCSFCQLYLVMLMGYSASEARRGLRSSQGNIELAIEFIIQVSQ
jgi:hypothetical protein